MLIYFYKNSISEDIRKDIWKDKIIKKTCENSLKVCVKTLKSIKSKRNNLVMAVLKIIFIDLID